MGHISPGTRPRSAEKPAAKNFGLSRESLLIERFAHAIEQLGSNEVAVRVRDIYALERIADESLADRTAIADTLTAYVRQRAPFPPNPDGPFPETVAIEDLPHLAVRAPDVQAAITVLGRRTPNSRNPASWISLDLARTDLRRADLNGANLSPARLRGSSLAKAWLHKTDFRGADLRDTNLHGASLREAVADITTWWPDEDFDPAAEGVHLPSHGYRPTSSRSLTSMAGAPILRWRLWAGSSVPTRHRS